MQEEIPKKAKIKVLSAELDTANYMAMKAEEPEVRAAANVRITELQNQIETLKADAA